ncbi:response regulator transcription factor [Pseudomonas citronellolis]|uniref:response regulator transcription factor n=1 Tax=Pseudomonas citronellolis TaxID=53408 RepID=UPI00209DF31F|nr:response regulator transcription factor [Pseudomonas citronellolis]MCP1641956.1 two-component system response regulator PfeR [Pseudomonas citronellolis]MCP1664874.1 two-component system response regulator PfeR [Pseudomonas citronellolis]MCP1695667.1 two-component system response regulator PfeR [Pseudomonas citronellolis]MCP1702710.1 two-component system response regulator PfeR [Pseudomonas citronellolis]MCP1796595.1 two-component system response regulator PfeR [Pseudomonas citronellolis]
MTPTATSQPRLLTIEDDPTLGAHLHSHLSQRGFAVTWCRDGREGLDQALSEAFDLVLLDVMLPGCSGLEALRQLRREQRVPVILMSALGAEQDRIAGFSQGADDYLPKPFSLAELNVRIDAILRRVALERGSLLPAGPADAGLRLREEPCEVAWEGQTAALTATEQRLLETFLGNVDETLSKPFLYQHVLNRGYTAHDRGLDMHVSHLRRKLQSIGYARHQLRAVWGKGYVFASAE